MEENNKTVSGSETEEQAGLPNGEPTVEQKKTLKSKIHKFLTDHANIFQIVKFTLISLIAFVAEFASMYALQYGLLDQYGNVPFKWFVFKYTPEKNFGLAGFIAMLVSKCIAEIISFTINRKKTFSANNNVVFSAIMYVITVISIIILSTWLAGDDALGGVLGAAVGADLGNGVRKVRMAISDKGRGKSGGARVITYTVKVDEQRGVVTLLTIYDKNEQESISRKDIDDLLREIG